MHVYVCMTKDYFTIFPVLLRQIPISKERGALPQEGRLSTCHGAGVAEIGIGKLELFMFSYGYGYGYIIVIAYHVSAVKCHMSCVTCHL